jgi:hypothetical protein
MTSSTGGELNFGDVRAADVDALSLRRARLSASASFAGALPVGSLGEAVPGLIARRKRISARSSRGVELRALGGRRSLLRDPPSWRSALAAVGET